ncbi:MAG: hypothetical protein A2845_05985 [Candidatus Lloydbacteria bacterium RIFCSPHIGHO2_01_FULL_49_22]|uniref:Uncharacterized protein n=1 Tax=Candidatus Lloydbacteria bacterium RIFCSPHIGHO2_01_FULL_49_22 TaxID=1798658 RepID=A0A1G2CYD8_9BACT|nr:MAG: hypothetical protein A2845_05985 [Candidatus Lloydbacteria bacterium RIFCSPHIGHO2_01_FULL_49_22]OGZ09771.1 MAG: hypothetical protein A3C14_00030 [Candidatus Lloydbacteria bacterium RIFCSPHIGHO2_02_FULL_50_18]
MNTHKTPRFSARKKNKDHMTLLLSSEAFQADVKLLRERFNIHKGGNTQDGAQLAWLSLNAPQMYEYVKAVSDLARAYQVPGNFGRHLKTYIEEGIVSNPVNRFDVIPPNPLNPSLTVQMHAKLTRDEKEDTLAEVDRVGEALMAYGTIKDLPDLLESERLYGECEQYNTSKDREYILTVKEQDPRNTDRHYENMRVLRKKRNERFGIK